jgi:hypothetical protein
MRRRYFIETVAHHTGGLFGRSQEYVPLFHLGMLDIKHDLARGDSRFERNIENYWRRAGEKDLMLVSIDTANAKQVPGVYAVLTGADLPEVLIGRFLLDCPVLARDTSVSSAKGGESLAPFRATVEITIPLRRDSLHIR